MIFCFIPYADAYENPNLFVSAQNPQFDNHFSGSMIVEVIINNNDIKDTGNAKGEPDVTLNGKSLKMIQATDGNWYAYFANLQKAKAADSTVNLAGAGLDFGVFCSQDTPDSVFGISLSQTEGFAVPSSDGITNFTNGLDSFSSCAGLPTGKTNINNVLRGAKSINTNQNVQTGQIGLNAGAWPLVQLYSFNDVTIQYNPGGASQKVSLTFDEIPNISITKDRDLYPQNSEIFLTLADLQLNQDPTDVDSWTFSVDTPSVFYQAFDNSGSVNVSLVDLHSSLSLLGFEDNGQLYIDTGAILELKSNDIQRVTSVSDGTQSFSQIITLVETMPNSGIFDNGDYNNQSNLGIFSDAPRGHAGTITYNKQSMSILTGPSSALLQTPTLSIDSLGKNLKVILMDSDQNINSGAKDNLDIFRDTATIPSMRIGSPVTLEHSSDVRFFSLSTTHIGDSAGSSVPDVPSARLFIDTSSVPNDSFKKISMNLGITSSTLQSSLIDSISNQGTNWLNYDFRSFANDLGVLDFSDTTLELFFGSLENSPVLISGPGNLASPQGFIQLDDSLVSEIANKTGNVFLVINFDSSNDSESVGTIFNETNLQPIIVDFFSFGGIDSDVNNSIYRFELKETSANSSTFEGSIEYSVANKLNILNPKFIQTIQTINDHILFIVIDRLIDEDAITISYSDLDKVGIKIPISSKSDINTSSGIVTSDFPSYRFGQPVTITVNDPDLNLKNDLIDIYFVNNLDSVNVDTVGVGESILLEILIKDIRYKRCTVNGVMHGGLGATGFTLVETSSSSGIFEGIFKMPSKICNKSGTKLISSAGGSIDVKYYDFKDSFGNASISHLQNTIPLPQLSVSEITRPLSGVKEITLSGNLEHHKRGVPLVVSMVYPDGRSQSFATVLSTSGSYKSVISINNNSLAGFYNLELYHENSNVGTASFYVIVAEAPAWVKNNAKLWSLNSISDSDFIYGIEFLVDEGIILPFPTLSESSEQNIPYWVKNNAKWWAEDQISDDDFFKSIQYLLKKGIIRI